MNNGLLVTVEGIDGSGKTTQVGLLKKYLLSKNIPSEVINFPRYEDNLYGKLIRRFLDGEFGDKKVNPYFLALSYAADRFLAKPLIESWLKMGKLVIANRYVSSSKAHLSANLPKDQREKFVKWVEELEYQTNRMPKEDLTILLKVDPKIGQINSQNDSRADIFEKDTQHEEIAARIYDELSKSENNWQIVECMEKGKLKSKEQIHKLLVAILGHFLVN